MVDHDAPIRLQKRMAQLGIASRRESERLISAGRVTVNGKLVTELGTKVVAKDRIGLDGKTAEEPPEDLVVALHKPPGYVTARTDPQGRHTVYDLLDPTLPFLAHVGRLDYQTEGVLLFTNDGELSRQLLHPSQKIPRVYVVKIRGILTRESIDALERGIPLDGRPTHGVVVERLPSKSRHDWLRLTLFEGRNRHVRRVVEAVGHSVTRLIRTQFATIDAETIAPGTARTLTRAEVTQLRNLTE